MPFLLTLLLAPFCGPQSMLSCQACAAVTAPFSQGMASQVEQDLRGLCRQRVTCEPERLKTDATFTSPLCYIHFSFVYFAERSQVFHASSSQVRPAPDLSSPLQSKVTLTWSASATLSTSTLDSLSLQNWKPLVV